MLCYQVTSMYSNSTEECHYTDTVSDIFYFVRDIKDLLYLLIDGGVSILCCQAKK